MNFEQKVARFQAAASKGVHITVKPDNVPKVCVGPGLRTPIHRLDGGKLEFVLLAQPTSDDCEVILTVPDVLGMHGDTQIGEGRANRIMPASQTSVGASPKPDERVCDLCRPGVGRDAWA